MNRVLVVDDDAQLRASLCTGLTGRGYRCGSASDAPSARELLSGPVPFDLVLLDVTMPGESGFEVVEWMRSRSDSTPVVFLTAHDSVPDRVRGLRLGADDYVAKPFEFEELMARIEAIARRKLPPVVYELGDVRVDCTARKALRDGRDLELSEREFALIEALLTADGAVLSRTELLWRVWKIRGNTDTNVVDVVVMRVRRKLDRHGTHSIQTVVGEGYQVKARRVRA